MAIYKNREVYLVSTFVPSNTNVELVAVSYTNGMRDNVPLNQVKFTEEEKKALIKDNPNKFENVEVATKEDVEAVRIGVTPPSDPSFKEAAEARVQKEHQDKKLAEMNEKAKAEAEKNFQKKVEAKTIPANAANPQANQLQQKAR
jgi:hypothetical protein